MICCMSVALCTGLLLLLNTVAERKAHQFVVANCAYLSLPVTLLSLGVLGIFGGIAEVARTRYANGFAVVADFILVVAVLGIVAIFVASQYVVEQVVKESSIYSIASVFKNPWAWADPSKLHNERANCDVHKKATKLLDFHEDSMRRVSQMGNADSQGGDTPRDSSIESDLGWQTSKPPTDADFYRYSGNGTYVQVVLPRASSNAKMGEGTLGERLDPTEAPFQLGVFQQTIESNHHDQANMLVLGLNVSECMADVSAGADPWCCS